MLHEELVRIEASWAHHANFGLMKNTCAKCDVRQLKAAWARGMQQKFPFPTAVMLHNASIDARAWELMRELNRSAAVRLTADIKAERSSKGLAESTENEKSLRWQRDAVEGAGFGRTQRLLGRTQRAPVSKLRRGSSAFRLPSFFSSPDAPEAAPEKPVAQDKSARKEKRSQKKARRASLQETDALATSLPPAPADDTEGGEQQQQQQQQQQQGRPSVTAGKPRPATAQLKDQLKDAPPSERRSAAGSSGTGAGRLSGTILRSPSSRRRQRQQRKLDAVASGPPRSILRVPSDSVTRFGESEQQPLPAPASLPGPTRAVHFSKSASSGRQPTRDRPAPPPPPPQSIADRNRAEEERTAREMVFHFARDTCRDRGDVRLSNITPPEGASVRHDVGFDRSPCSDGCHCSSALYACHPTLSPAHCLCKLHHKPSAKPAIPSAIRSPMTLANLLLSNRGLRLSRAARSESSSKSEELDSLAPSSPRLRCRRQRQRSRRDNETWARHASGSGLVRDEPIVTI